MVEHLSPKQAVPRSSRGTPASEFTGGVKLTHLEGVMRCDEPIPK